MGTRKANGHGHTYNIGGSYKTVIRHKGHVVTATAKTAQESRRIAKERTLLLPTFVQSVPISKNKIKLNDFLLEWLQNEHQHNIAHSTYLRYRGLAVNHINPLVGDYYLKDLTPKLLTWLLLQMKEAGQSPRSQQQARALLSICLKSAEDQELIAANPIRRVRNPQNRQKKISPLNESEVRRLLTTYMGTWMEARLHIAVLCGLRQGEALGLEWSDIDFENRTLRVSKQFQKINNIYTQVPLKTERSERTIILTEQTVIALRNHWELLQSNQQSDNEWLQNDLVFPGLHGRPRSPESDYKSWQKCLKLCGIPPKRLHDARHTAATLMYSKGVGIETISRALGHSSSAITSRLYVHNAEEPLRKAAEMIDELLRKV